MTLAINRSLISWGVVPFARRNLFGEESKTYNAVGPYPLWVVTIAPGLVLTLLAVLPTDRRAIRAIAVATIAIIAATAAFTRCAGGVQLMERMQCPLKRRKHCLDNPHLRARRSRMFVA